ncbi:hypothetical protein pdam_00009824, partial [Pocillopora damicornis]
MDVAIFGDISKSMKKQQRRKLSCCSWHFANTADIHNKLNNKEYYDAGKLRKAVKEIFMVRPKKFGTRTDLALDLAAREVFTAAGGDIPKAKNVLIIVTDGKPHIPKREKKTFIPFETSTKALEPALEESRSATAESLRLRPTVDVSDDLNWTLQRTGWISPVRYTSRTK